MTSEDSPYFTVAPPSDGKRVAPGMTSNHVIKFTPDAVKDYAHEIICTTEREKFLVPIKAVGSRGMVDFPDLINFGECPVKMTRTKTIFVRNIGKFLEIVDFTLNSQAPELSRGPSARFVGSTGALH